MFFISVSMVFRVDARSGCGQLFGRPSYVQRNTVLENIVILEFLPKRLVRGVVLRGSCLERVWMSLLVTGGRWPRGQARRRWGKAETRTPPVVTKA